MPKFAYAGRTRGGDNVTGERTADNADAAVAALRREQILVTRIAPTKEKAGATATARQPRSRTVPKTVRNTRGVHRTGYRGMANAMLFEHIPGGSRWRCTSELASA